jgi:tRNA(fMet)-specific endonuclease VapC
MNRYTLDTNIVTARLKQNPLITQRMEAALIAGHSVQINAVSYYETKRGLLAIGSQKRLAAFILLCQTLGIMMIDQAALDKASELYAGLRKGGVLIEDADILAAAIAIVNDMVLVTNNTQHFARITGLQIEDWLAP